ncbi:cytochrome C biogenesis protein [Leptospira ognonensis]|uniref:Cytochrome C biogenesis protein n=1 Tax=Leptospira ognonensis TaxID=2484945 RepID=A0A4R9K108_9LEPT|nr:cytochrome C biogenesis protein [Leptospira ognonensis]TGL59343.1 cytochrome C biogenesis protein [Leptospira ognonensis]
MRIRIFLRNSLFHILLFGALLISNRLLAQSTTTTLKDPNHIEIFLDVTSKIRCICLPSLPIQSCSFNMCTASAYLKNFIENRIKDGMPGDEIIFKMEHGFGEAILNDSIVLHFQKEGNQGMVDSLVYGFGDKILAKPDSTWINGTLFLFGLLGLTGIFLYFRKNRKIMIQNETNKGKTDLSELQSRIRAWENRE